MSIGAWRVRTRLRFMVTITCVLGAALLWIYSRDPTSISPVSSLNGEATRPRRLGKDITVVFRQFEEFDHDLSESARSWSSSLSGAPALVFVDKPLYPPLSPVWEGANGVRNSSVREISLELTLTVSPRELDPLFHVNTEFVLIVPDGSRAPSRKALRALLARAVASSTNIAHVIPGTSSQEPLLCLRIHWSYRDWTLRYERSTSSPCDGVHGKHALLIRTALLRELPQPFVLPFPEALYLQTSAKNVKLQILEAVGMGEGRGLLEAAGARAKAARVHRERRTSLYKRLGVKRLLRDDGDVQWYGCTRDTERCFPAVIGVPVYLMAGRFTPPCCLRHLHRTARHVLHTLLMAGARCWLEGITLLGAVTRGQSTQWAERGQLGVHAGDVGRVSWLQLAAERGTATDDAGYVWETTSHYYRVAYSHANRIYIDILPFLPRNGTMTQDGWFLEHQRDFPEHFLHPMGSVKFSGISAPAPNNVRDFLQLKFGPNVIENSATLGYKLIYP